MAGSRYEETKNLSTTEIAKLVRADIKAAVKAGELPAATYSVRCGGGAMCSSIDIKVRGRVPFAATALTTRHGCNGYWMLTTSSEMLSLLRRLDGISSAYNYDNSDIQTDYFDVRFYGHASDDTDNRREEYEAAKAAGILDNVQTWAEVNEASLYDALGLEVQSLNYRIAKCDDAAKRGALADRAMAFEVALQGLVGEARLAA